MKKTIFAFMAIATLGLAACQKNETPDPEPTPAELAAGVYDGQLSIELGGSAMGDPIDQQVEIIAAEDGTVTLSIKNLSVLGGMITFDEISLPGCPVTKNDDGSLSTSTKETVTLTFDKVGECDIDMAGSINDEEAVLDLDIVPKSLGGTTVTAHFEGTRSETAAE